jgi:mRNA degradation ribonuclease J1/J2
VTRAVKAVKKVKKVKPDVLIPIHTLNPEGFREWSGDVRIVKQGETFKV